MLYLVHQEFNGNTDGSSVVRHWLKPRFNARYVRFVPILWTGQQCMRVEIYGCKATVFPSVETIMKTLTKGEELKFSNKDCRSFE